MYNFIPFYNHDYCNINLEILRVAQVSALIKILSSTFRSRHTY